MSLLNAFLHRTVRSETTVAPSSRIPFHWTLRILPLVFWLFVGVQPSSPDDRAQTIFGQYKAIHSVDRLGDFRVKIRHTRLDPSDSSKNMSYECSIIQSGDRYISHQQTGSTVYEYSWDGETYLHTGIDTKAPRSTNWTYLLDNKPQSLYESDILYKFLDLRHESDERNKLDVRWYDPQSRCLALGFGTAGKSIAEKIYLSSDTSDSTYSKIEYYNPRGKLTSYQIAREWKRFGDLLLPQEVIVRIGDSGYQETFELLEFGQISPDETDFKVHIPYQDNIYIQDSREDPPKTIQITKLTKSLCDHGKYLIALDDYYRQEALGVEKAKGRVISSIERDIKAGIPAKTKVAPPQETPREAQPANNAKLPNSVATTSAHHIRLTAILVILLLSAFAIALTIIIRTRRARSK
jgi:hypothetical protein